MKLSVADAVWIACALLHREHPQRQSFRRAEIARKVQSLQLRPIHRKTLDTHLSQHCLAQKRPNDNRLRILSREPDGALRLFRAGDPYHPDRGDGKIVPQGEVLPPRYRRLLTWYWTQYAHGNVGSPEEDPILALRGVGKEVWRDVGGEAFIAALRSGWHGPSAKGNELRLS